ncbi:sensor domain-containing diguanylate cyclase [Glacieibacterium frigidum]|uniref:Sensor domain-containing diguanylate cyclase n=1 Tax=Glacieibacterium frigidum TaxID=2593303 RepID=A0A552U993_9SPHN|nr:sensor domain-containing diguanylate cyclase [Glacieibacterium frigidum]TRW14781.1 sensor domain-containing diguanylate cyclase [Glacieibacterium frigidum]
MTAAFRGAEMALLTDIHPSLRSRIASLIEQRIHEGVRSATELALRNTHLAQEGGRIGIFDIDMATGDSLGSPMWAELLGQERTACSITRRAWIKLLHPEDRDRELDSVASMVQTGADTSADYRIILPTGEVRWLHSRNLVTRRSSDGAMESAYGTLQDITERKALEAQVLRAAYHDDLTGLPNRRYFMEQLTAACPDASRNHRVCLAIYDLDFLKRANDQHGHDAGDVLLKSVADRLLEVGGNQAVVARLGGDEFALLLRTDDPSKLRSLAEKSLAALRSPINFRGCTLSSAASAGGAISSRGSTLAAALFRQADQALLCAKRGSRGSYVQHRRHAAPRALRLSNNADRRRIEPVASRDPGPS